MGIAAEKEIIADRHEANSNRMLFMMAAALGRRDTYTHAHAQRVSSYSRRLATRAQLSGDILHDIALGGMLHDVGKLALSDNIFSNKQVSLSEKMLGEVRSHPLIGAALLSHIHCNSNISNAVLLHHERIDGSGYPFGLHGNEIPLAAKIVSIADCFDAITTDRPYQRRKTCEHAILILEEMADTRLDSDLVALMIEEIHANGKEPIMPDPNEITPHLTAQ